MESEVIVVGAGPTGLMLAGELRLAGVDVLVVDRLVEPTGQSRGLGFTTRAMEVFDQRGLLPRFGDIEVSPSGHFGGIPLDFSVMPGANFGARGIKQSEVERVLTERAEELGARFLRGYGFEALNEGSAEGDDGVKALVRGPEGERLVLCASWLVGCDGGQSDVRKSAGFTFQGTSSTREMFLADVRGCNLPPRFTGMRVPGGMAMNAPLGDGVDRIIACELGAAPSDRTGPVAFSEVAGAWKRLTGEDISSGEPEWVSAFGDAARQATEYRRGRVLLAGDAAHIHLPAGGQGLSVGIQDAVNLGWKLALTLRGHAPEDLVDTYHDERHPVGARVLMNSSAQGHLYLSGPEVGPLRELFGELMRHEEVGRHLAGMVSGLDVRYEFDSGRHPLIGRRIPPVDLVNGSGETSTFQVLHSGRGQLLCLDYDARLETAAQGWSDRVDVVMAGPASADDGGLTEGTNAVLVRPDGYVAWASPGHTEELPQALHRWFGPQGSAERSYVVSHGE